MTEELLSKCSTQIGNHQFALGKKIPQKPTWDQLQLDGCHESRGWVFCDWAKLKLHDTRGLRRGPTASPSLSPRIGKVSEVMTKECLEFQSSYYLPQLGCILSASRLEPLWSKLYGVHGKPAASLLMSIGILDVVVAWVVPSTQLRWNTPAFLAKVLVISARKITLDHRGWGWQTKSMAGAIKFQSDALFWEPRRWRIQTAKRGLEETCC